MPTLDKEDKVRLTVVVSKRTHEMLAELLETGLYGFSTGQAAERLITKGLQEALTNPFIVREIAASREETDA